MHPDILQSLTHKIYNAISTASPGFLTDPLTDCPVELVSKVLTQPNEAIRVAEKELNVFPFSNVGKEWARLFVDGCLGVAMNVIKEVMEDTGGRGKQGDDWLDEVVALLDRTLIIVGGIGREELIWEVLEKLRRWEDEISASADGKGKGKVDDRGDEGRARKRRRISSSPITIEKEGKAEQDYVDIDDDFLPQNRTVYPEIKHPIRRLHCPSLTEFQNHMDKIKTPVILTGIIEHWPALKQWRKKSYWMRETFKGRRLVPLELGRSYTDEDWGQRIMPFREFLKNYIVEEGKESPHDSGSDFAVTTQQTGYLAQHNLFRQIPSLRSAITVPDYCYLDAPPPEPGTPVYLSRLKSKKKNKNDVSGPKISHPSTLGSAIPESTPPQDHIHTHADHDSDNDDMATDSPIQTNIWFGPAWTITPLHHDPHHNILCQVVGAKYIRLYSAHDSARLYPRSDREPAPHLKTADGNRYSEAYAINTTEEESSSFTKTNAGQTEKKKETETEVIDMSNTSSIDVSAIELSPIEDWDTIYPGLSELEYVECVLQAGEALYVPIGWWHYVRSCETGVSVSFWWGG